MSVRNLGKSHVLYFNVIFLLMFLMSSSPIMYLVTGDYRSNLKALLPPCREDLPLPLRPALTVPRFGSGATSELMWSPHSLCAPDPTFLLGCSPSRSQPKVSRFTHLAPRPAPDCSSPLPAPQGVRSTVVFSGVIKLRLGPQVPPDLGLAVQLSGGAKHL